jgi:hypothetical protein
MSLNEELYKPIPFCAQYEISTFGNVRNNKLSILKTQKHNKGYKQIQLCNKHYLIHRLVAIVHVENPCPGVYNIIDHIDGNKLNNNFNNLRWVNQSMNARNRIKFNSNTNYGGISKITKNGTFQVCYCTAKYTYHKKYFKNIEDAVAFRKQMVDNYYNVTISVP